MKSGLLRRRPTLVLGILILVACVLVTMADISAMAQELSEIRCLVDRTIQTSGNPNALHPTSYARWCTMTITFAAGGGSAERFAACRIPRGQLSCTIDPGTLEPVPADFSPVLHSCLRLRYC
jgi:hypothetical protein